MMKKFPYAILSASLALSLLSPLAFGQEKTTTSTTTIETIQTKPAPVKKTTRVVKPAPKPVAKSAPAPATTTSVMSTTTTTEVKPPPPKEVAHTVYSEDQLEKMSNTLCSDGFKAYVGSEKKNVCKSKATTPDLAYSCVWDKDGPAAFAATPKGPCNLDYVEHQGSVLITKDNFADDPPLKYGMEAQCCFRPAKGLESAAK